MASFVFDSPIGLLFGEVTPSGLRRLDFISRQHDLSPGVAQANVRPAAIDASGPAERAIAQGLLDQLDEYFHGSRTDFEIPLDVGGGSTFQRRVWQQIAAIAYGETASYAEVALRAGYPNAFRAVGSACGLNPIALVVPCHRVVASGGRLGGYGGGLETKVWLLRHEGWDCDGTTRDSLIRAKKAASLGV